MGASNIITTARAEYLVFDSIENDVTKKYKIKIINYREEWFINTFILLLLWMRILERRDTSEESFNYHVVADYIMSKGKRIRRFSTMVPLISFKGNNEEFYVSQDSKACEPLVWLIASFGRMSLSPLQLPPQKFDFSYQCLHSLLRKPDVMQSLAWFTNMPDDLVKLVLSDSDYSCHLFSNGSIGIFYNNRQYSLSVLQMILLLLFNKKPGHLMSQLGLRSDFVVKALYLIKFPEESLLYMLV